MGVIFPRAFSVYINANSGFHATCPCYTRTIPDLTESKEQGQTTAPKAVPLETRAIRAKYLMEAGGLGRISLWSGSMGASQPQNTGMITNRRCPNLTHVPHPQTGKNAELNMKQEMEIKSCAHKHTHTQTLLVSTGMKASGGDF